MKLVTSVLSDVMHLNIIALLLTYLLHYLLMPPIMIKKLGHLTLAQKADGLGQLILLHCSNSQSINQ